MMANLSSVPLPAVARGIANHLWQSTAFAVVAGFIVLLLQRHGAQLRHWVWMAASVKFLLPFSLLVSIGSHLAQPVMPSEPVTRAYVALDRMSQPFVSDQLFAMATGHEQPRAEERPSSTQLILQVAATIWLCGFLGITGYWLVQWRRLRRIVSAATPLPEGRELALFRKVQQGMGLSKKSRRIELFAAESWTEPGVVGVFHPVLLWPEGVSDHLDDAHLEAIFAHELCHVTRRDNLTALLHMAVESVFWFHPLVWWMGRQIVAEREQACDEHVLQSGKDPGAYAESILRVCKFCLESPLACVSGVSGADLKKRVVLIMKADIVAKLGYLGKGLLCTTAAIILALPLFIGRAAGAYSAKNALTTSSLAQTGPQAPIPTGSATAGTEAGGAWEMNAPKLEFDVASVKQSKPGGDSNSNIPLGPGSIYVANGGNFIASGMPLSVYIMFAYKMSAGTAQELEKQVPGWVMTEKYDIVAKTDKHDVTKDEMRLMMRSLLAERFKLMIHTEIQQMPVYWLILVKPRTLGPKLVAHSTSESCDTTPPPQTLDSKTPPLTVAGGFPAICGGIVGLPNSTPGMTTLGARDVPLGQLASVLTGLGNLGRPVQDHTGLIGMYDFVLELVPTPRLPEGDSGNNQGADSGGPGLEQALKQQLGLKLESKQGGVTVWVVDHVEHATPN